MNKSNLEFLYKDDFLFAIKKPSNIHSCISLKNDDDSIAKRLLEKYPKLQDVGKKEDAGLLNRLDFETSGILYGTWHSEAYKKLKGLKNGALKVYIAITEGKSKTTNLKTYIGGAYRGSKKVTVYELNKNPKRALLAESQIKLLSYNKEKNLSLVCIKILEGRRHQIRAHLSYLGTPILGDTLYGAKREVKEYFNFENLPKFLLHNESLSLKNPFTNRKINIECECVWKELSKQVLKKNNL